MSLYHPLITIGITCFNAEKTILFAIESALKQEWNNKEIIIVDDCSTDSSIDLIKREFERRDILRYFVNSKNLGVASSRNRIIQEAKGDYVAFFDDDDISVPERLTLQFDRINSYITTFNIKQPVICHSARQINFNDSSSQIIKTMGCKLNTIAPHGTSVASRILLGTPLEDGYGAMATCSQMGRVVDYRTVGGFDENLRRSEDTELNIRLALNGCHFVGISQSLVVQSVTKTSDKSFEAEYDSVGYYLIKHQDFIDKYSSFEFVKSWAEVKFMFLQHKYLIFILKFSWVALKFPLLTVRRLFYSFPNINHNLRFSDSR